MISTIASVVRHGNIEIEIVLGDDQGCLTERTVSKPFKFFEYQMPTVITNIITAVERSFMDILRRRARETKTRIGPQLCGNGRCKVVARAFLYRSDVLTARPRAHLLYEKGTEY
jgi:hypothetical protein